MSEKFVVIGLTDDPEPYFLPEVLDIIRQGRVFSGGKRHHAMVAPLLPADAQWIDITAPLDAVFEQYFSLFTSHFSLPIVVFASGDPLFYGFANTIRRKMPEAGMKVYPAFNSLQMLAHRLLMPYHDMRIVSLTGRPWPAFDRALIEGVPQIGILTDREHTPAAIAQRMLDYGYSDYTMYVGEHLGNPMKETVSRFTLEDAANRDFKMPNCLILKSVELRTESLEFATAIDRTALGTSAEGTEVANSLLSTLHSPLKKPFGIPDSEFALLDGREKMITKMPIRLLTLQALDLPKKHVFWDIGFCTGSVSIEARLQFPHLHIHAFEVRPECEAIIHENARRHGAPGISIYMGDFIDTDLSLITDHLSLPPDAVFIGGHSGRLKDIMAKILTVLTPDGCIVMNSVKAPKVTTDSHRLWDEACLELGLQQEPPMRIVLDDHHPIEILKARRKI